jgi:N-acetylmuramoyl-L-alanine amidase
MLEFKKPARPVDKVFIHCSASDAVNLAGEELVAEIRRWHLARGFADVGYHFLIDKAGRIMAGRSLEQIPAAQEGHNAGSIAICLHGLAIEKFTAEALDSLAFFCRQIDAAYGGAVTFHGHCEVNPRKSCPVFDYKTVLGLDDAGRMTP